MKKLALLTLATSFLALGAFSNIKANRVTKEERDATIIVKMKTNVEKYSQQALVAQQNSLLNEISRNITSNFKVTSRYSNIFNGFVLEVPSAYVSDIRSLNRVDKIDYNKIIAEESSNQDGVNYVLPAETGIDKSSASSQTMEKPEGTNNGAKTFIAILDSGFYIQTDATTGEQTYHEVFAPLNEEDAVISQAEIRSRIDEAGDSFHGQPDDDHTTYFNNKVIFYYDYGGDKSSMTTPDYDVFFEGSEHGTHVASIAGGNAGAKYEGVAPRAQMALMKVFRTYMSGQTYVTGAPTDAILNALEDCLVLGADSINMSLGSNLDDFDEDSIIEDVIRELESKGQFVNIANGNEGKGQWSSSVYRYWGTDMVETNIISSYANNMASLSVASAQADYQFYGEALTVDGKNVQYEDQVVNYNSTDGPVTYDPERHLTDLRKGGQDEFDFVYLPGVGAKDEYADVDAAGKIVVTNRGTINFSDKVKNAAAEGAIAIIIINNTSEKELKIKMSFLSYQPTIPVGFAVKSYQDVFAKSTSKKAKFLIDTDLNNPTARTISDYSSDGMKYDLSIKPEISAPGENIKGAVLGATDKYESMSGTSMATPNITGAIALMLGEHLEDDATYRPTIKARMMSTAIPMKDYTEAANYTSVRRQGAGLINLDAAMNSKVYLDGVDANNQRIGKAKVELFNNDDIKEGKVKIKFAAINEGNAPVTYTAKTYVLAPGTGTFDEEIFPDFAGTTFQAIEDQLVQVFEDEVTINVGESIIALPDYQIDSDKLAALDADFESGCILEGYTILTAENEYQLSVPFLGFYGDLEKVSPVEPFDFEKEDKTYTSDLLNYLVSVNIGKGDDYDYTKADFTSHLAEGYWKNSSSASFSSVIRNSLKFTSMTDDNSNRVNIIGKDLYSGQYNPDNLIVGNNAYANTLVMQQYMTRSVRDNSVELISKATGETLRTEHLYDALSGWVYDSDLQRNVYPLYKSHFDSALFERGYMAHRAVCVFPLEKDGVKVPDGEYTLRYSYDLMAGGTYVKEYNITVDSGATSLKSVEKVGDNYRLHYVGSPLGFVSINDKSYEPVKEEGGFYADVPVSSLNEDGKALVKAIATSFAQEQYLTHLNDENGVMIYNKLFTTNYDFTYTLEKTASSDYKYTFDITEKGKAGTTSGDISYCIKLPSTFDEQSLKVYSISNKGTEKELKFTVANGSVYFATTIKTIRLVSDPVTITGLEIVAPTKLTYETGEQLDLTGLEATLVYSNGKKQPINVSDLTIGAVDLSKAGTKTVTVSYEGYSTSFEITVNKKEGEKKGCGGSVIASSAIISIIASLGACLLMLRKKKEEDK